MLKIPEICTKLITAYGLQGWWPVKASGKNKANYHPGRYSYPENRQQEFEIMVGAILTQSTSWKNVELAMENLGKNNLLSPEKIRKCDAKKLARVIRPSGYHNQKAKKLKAFAEFYLKGKIDRENLLGVWGIGKETADSIMLYARKEPFFVVDAYTRRVFSRLGLLEGKEGYDSVRGMFEKNLPRRHELHNEYHALIVEHAKSTCTRIPKCAGCSLKSHCAYYRDIWKPQQHL